MTRLWRKRITSQPVESGREPEHRLAYPRLDRTDGVGIDGQVALHRCEVAVPHVPQEACHGWDADRSRSWLVLSPLSGRASSAGHHAPVAPGVDRAQGTLSRVHNSRTSGQSLRGPAHIGMAVG